MREKKARGRQGEIKPDESCILKLISSRRGVVRPSQVAVFKLSYFV